MLEGRDALQPVPVGTTGARGCGLVAEARCGVGRGTAAPLKAPRANLGGARGGGRGCTSRAAAVRDDHPEPMQAFRDDQAVTVA